MQQIYSTYFGGRDTWLSSSMLCCIDELLAVQTSTFAVTSQFFGQPRSHKPQAKLVFRGKNFTSQLLVDLGGVGQFSSEPERLRLPHFGPTTWLLTSQAGSGCGHLWTQRVTTQKNVASGMLIGHICTVVQWHDYTLWSSRMMSQAKRCQDPKS